MRFDQINPKYTQTTKTLRLAVGLSKKMSFWSPFCCWWHCLVEEIGIA